MWALPVVELHSLNTLILEERLSTFNTFTFSWVPTPIISFSFIVEDNDCGSKFKYVTIPVAEGAPIAVNNLNVSVLTPICTDESFLKALVDNPETVINSLL